MEMKNICGKIPVELHEKLKLEVEELGISSTGIFPHMFFISIVFVLLSFFYIQHTLKRDRKLFTIPNEYEALKSSQRMQIQ